MSFNPEAFYTSFSENLDTTIEMKASGKTSTAVDTLRVFKATDFACMSQPDFFPLDGKPTWRGEGGSEFLCDYTYRNSNARVLLALESEWGTAASSEGTKKKVMYDFEKVMNMAAPVKVIVFAYTNDDNKQDSLNSMATLIMPWPQECIGTLMAISCPWNDEMNSKTISGFVWQTGKWVKIN